MQNKFTISKWFSTIFFLILLVLSGCNANSASASEQKITESVEVQEVVDSMMAATVATQAAEQAIQEASNISEGEQIIRYWLSPAVPAGYLTANQIFNQASPVEQPDQASVTVMPLAYHQNGAEGSISAQWIYAVVAPFPTTVDNVSLDDILMAWQGYAVESFGGNPLMMSDSTRVAFETFWGRQASDQGIKVVESQELLNLAWSTRPSWAIIPFEELSPRWKVIQVNGESPLDKNMDVSSYPLKVSFILDGDVEVMEQIHAQVDSGSVSITATNRDSAKMADVLLTGVTALVRYTALRMEEQGLTYPALDIVDWLANADITHVSNEVPFDDDCPPAVPLRREARFCSDPSYIELLQFAGVDVVELTGNHLLDWGEEPFIETLDIYKENNISYYGGGYTLEEGRQPYLTEINGNKIAFIGCNAMGPESDWATEELAGSASCDMDWMESEIKRLSADGYQVIVTFQHFEVCEFQPQSTQKIDFERMARAGAVIVSGSQAHCPQGITFVDDHFIHYGLGNLFFDQMDQYSVREFLDLHVFYDGKYIGTQLLTAMLEDYSQPRPMTAEERKLLLEEVFEGSDW